MDYLQLSGFVLLGFGVGCIGTLIGAGGGFILLPLLLLLYPDKSPEQLTSISLAVVFINSLSGSAAYAKLKRIDYRSGLAFALATLPGAIIGAYTTKYVPRNSFDILLGVLLICIGLFLFLRPNYQTRALTTREYRVLRKLTDSEGTRYSWSYNMVTGISISFLVGFLSSLLGIGGGIIHVPVLTALLHFPVPIATATSHFILAIMSLAGTGAHLAQGNLNSTWPVVLSIGAGVVAGAQLGAWISHRTKAERIVRVLAAALLVVGIRLLLL